MILERKYDWNRPYFAGKFEIDTISFYNPKVGIIVLETKSGWLEKDRSDLVKIDLPNCKRKIKLDLTSKVPFFIKSKVHSYKSDVYILYIPTTLVDFKSGGEFVHHSDSVSESIYEKFTIQINGSLTTVGELISHNVELYNYLRTEKKEFGLEVEKFSKLLQEKHITLESRHIIKLMENFIMIDKSDQKAVRKQKLINIKK